MGAIALVFTAGVGAFYALRNSREGSMRVAMLFALVARRVVGTVSMDSFAVELERELPGNAVVSIGYLHVRALHVILSRNANVPTVMAPEVTPCAVACSAREIASAIYRRGRISRVSGSDDDRRPRHVVARFTSPLHGGRQGRRQRSAARRRL